MIFVLNQGKGKYVWLDGRTYEGDFVNGKMEGYGIFKWPNGIKIKKNL